MFPDPAGVSEEPKAVSEPPSSPFRSISRDFAKLGSGLSADGEPPSRNQDRLRLGGAAVEGMGPVTKNGESWETKARDTCPIPSAGLWTDVSAR